MAPRRDDDGDGCRGDGRGGARACPGEVRRYRRARRDGTRPGTRAAARRCGGPSPWTTPSLAGIDSDRSGSPGVPSFSFTRVFSSVPSSLVRPSAQRRVACFVFGCALLPTTKEFSTSETDRRAGQNLKETSRTLRIPSSSPVRTNENLVFDPAPVKRTKPRRRRPSVTDKLLRPGATVYVKCSTKYGAKTNVNDLTGRNRNGYTQSGSRRKYENHVEFGRPVSYFKNARKVNVNRSSR